MTVETSEHAFLRSPPGVSPVLVKGMFRGTPERLFRAFTEPEEISSWFTPVDGRLLVAEIDLQIGGRWCFVVDRTAEKQTQLEGKYLVIERPNRLEFSWRHVDIFSDGRREETDVSHVTITFTEAGQATAVDLRHEAIKTEAARFGVGGGWNSCFGYLKDYLTK